MVASTRRSLHAKRRRPGPQVCAPQNKRQHLLRRWWGLLSVALQRTPAAALLGAVCCGRCAWWRSTQPSACGGRTAEAALLPVRKAKEQLTGALELGGRWSHEAANFGGLLARLRARAAPASSRFSFTSLKFGAPEKARTCCSSSAYRSLGSAVGTLQQQRPISSE